MESTMDTRNDTIKCNKVHYVFMILSVGLGKCNHLSTDCDRTYSTRPPILMKTEDSRPCIPVAVFRLR